jgi:hypothetical protein
MLTPIGVRPTVNLVPDVTQDTVLARPEGRAFLLAWSGDPPEAGQTLAALGHPRGLEGALGRANHTGYDRAGLNGLSPHWPRPSPRHTASR